MFHVSYNVILVCLAVFNMYYLLRNNRAGSLAMLCTMVALSLHISALVRLFCGIATLQWFFAKPDILTVPNGLLGVYWFGGAIPHYMKAIRFLFKRKRQKDRLRVLRRDE